LSTSRPDHIDERGRPAATAVEAVAAAYYANEVGAASAARERAQRSYAIAGALATTLLAAGAFTGIADRSAFIKGVGLAALVLWGLAAALYARAIATPIKQLEPEKLRDPGGFVEHALTVARAERQAVDGRLNAAQICGGFASLATLATLLLAFFVPAERTGRSVLVSQRGRETVALVCAIDPSTTILPGEVDSRSLAQEYVRLHIPGGACDKSAPVELLLPKSDVLGVEK
jgi:hypothetical protein